MREQAQLAIDSADCIVMVTELSAGVTPQDQDVAGMLMRSGKPVVLAVNKCDKSANLRWSCTTFTASASAS